MAFSMARFIIAGSFLLAEAYAARAQQEHVELRRQTVANRPGLVPGVALRPALISPVSMGNPSMYAGSAPQLNLHGVVGRLGRHRPPVISKIAPIELPSDDEIDSERMLKLQALLNDLSSKSQFVDAVTPKAGDESNTTLSEKLSSRVSESSPSLLDAFRDSLNDLDPSILDGFSSSLNDNNEDDELLDAFWSLSSQVQGNGIDEEEFMEPESKMNGSIPRFVAPVPRFVISKSLTSEYKPLESERKNDVLSEYKNDLESEYENGFISEYNSDLVSEYTSDLVSEYKYGNLVSQYGLPATDISEYKKKLAPEGHNDLEELD